MGYSKNIQTLRDFLPRLEPLLRGESLRVETRPGDAAWFAYKFHEAFSLGERFPHLRPGIAHLRAQWRVTTPSDSLVVVERRKHLPPPGIPDLEGPERRTIDSAAFFPGEQAKNRIEEAIARWRALSSRSKLSLRSTVPYLPEELLSLWQWASEEEVLIFEDGAGTLTLLPLEGNEDAAEFSWSPSEEQLPKGSDDTFPGEDLDGSD